MRVAVALGAHVSWRRRAHAWPLYTLFLAFPLWWVLGAGAFIWPILAVPMVLQLVMRPRIRVPRGFGLWVLFLVWMLGSATQLDTPDRWIPFLYRTSLYLSATVILLYVVNMPRSILPDRKLVLTLTVFWMIVVVGGFLGTLLPRAGFRSPVEVVLPERLAANSYVRDLVHPEFAQISQFLGYEAPRPKAPFEYSNDWGAVFGLTVPFVLMGWGMASGLWRKITAGILVLSVIPVVVSLNRGLWLSLGVGFGFAAVRLAQKGRTRLLGGLLLILASVGLLLLLSPLRGIVEARIAAPHSNEGRLALYTEALTGVEESPVLGFGSPRPASNPNLPSVGTQGQFWLVLYSHGIPGATLFVGWYLWWLWRTRRARTNLLFWARVVILIGLVQLPFYGQLPAQLHVLMVAIGLASRDLDRPPAVPREEALVGVGEVS